MVENMYVTREKITALLSNLIAYKNSVNKNSITSSCVNARPYVATDIYTKSVAKHVFPLIPNFALAINKGDAAFDAMAVINVGYDLSGVNPSYQNCSSQFEYYGISLKKHNNVNGLIRKSSIQLTPDINRTIVDVLADRNTDEPYRSYKTVLVLTDIIDTLDYKDRVDKAVIDWLLHLSTLFDFTYLTFSEMNKSMNSSMRCRYYPFNYKGTTRYRVVHNFTGYNYSPTMYANYINARLQNMQYPLNHTIGDGHMSAHVFRDDDLIVIDRGQYNFNDCIDNNGFTKMFDDKNEKDVFIRDNDVAPIYKHMIDV